MTQENGGIQERYEDHADYVGRFFGVDEALCLSCRFTENASVVVAVGNQGSF